MFSFEFNIPLFLTPEYVEFRGILPELPTKDEQKDMGNEVAFSFGRPVSICEVRQEVDLFRHPERCFGF
jgi:hypothetical protein